MLQLVSFHMLVRMVCVGSISIVPDVLCVLGPKQTCVSSSLLVRIGFVFGVVDHRPSGLMVFLLHPSGC